MEGFIGLAHSESLPDTVEGVQQEKSINLIGTPPPRFGPPGTGRLPFLGRDVGPRCRREPQSGKEAKLAPERDTAKRGANVRKRSGTQGKPPTEPQPTNKNPWGRAKLQVNEKR